MADIWHRFLQAFGSPNHVTENFADGTDALMDLVHGIPRRPAYDLDNAELVLSFGAPLFESWWSPLQAYTAFAAPPEDGERRRRVVQVDSRFSRTAAFATDWIGVHPGTYGVLALGLAYVILRDGLYDQEFVAEYVSGFEDSTDAAGETREGYRSLVSRRYRTEEVSAITGVPVDRITDMARAFATSDRSLAVCGRDVMMAPNGLLAGMAVHSLNVLVGNINRRGGVLFAENPPLASLPTLVPDDASRLGSAAEPIAGPAPPFGSTDRADHFAETLAQSEEALIDTLFVYEADPLTSSGRADAWAEAIRKIPFVVSFSPFLDSTAQQADVVLPDLLSYERWQDAPTPTSYPYPAWAIVRPLVEPHPGGAHTGEVVLALAESLGGSVAQSLPQGSFEDLLKARAQGLFEARRGMPFASAIERENHRLMQERGWWLPISTDFEDFWALLVERGGWLDPFHDHADPGGIAQTASGRIDLLPTSLAQILDAEGDGRLPYVDVGDPATGEDESFPLRLIPYRVSTLASSTIGLERWMAEQPSVLPDIQYAPWVTVAPATAEELGLDDGASVWVVSERARYSAHLKVSAGTALGTVTAPYGLQHADGASANPLTLLDGSSDSLTGLPSWHTTLVRLERA